MPDEPGGRTVAQVHEYLRIQLNHALRRPGMYGGETALLLLADALAFTEDHEQSWHAAREELEARGGHTPTGVTGAVHQQLGEADPHAMASVYAEPALQQGWLTLDRTLSAADYDRLRSTCRSWCAQDRTLSEVTATFGPPSVLFGSSNPHYRATLGYVGEDLICFHFGSIPFPTDQAPQPHPDPPLLAVRTSGGDFAEAFTFTPVGAARRPR